MGLLIFKRNTECCKLNTLLKSTRLSAQKIGKRSIIGNSGTIRIWFKTLVLFLIGLVITVLRKSVSKALILSWFFKTDACFCLEPVSVSGPAIVKAFEMQKSGLRRQVINGVLQVVTFRLWNQFCQFITGLVEFDQKYLLQINTVINLLPLFRILINHKGPCWGPSIYIMIVLIVL